MADFNDGTFGSPGGAAVPRAPDPYKSGPGLQPGQAIPGMDWINWSGGGPSGQYFNQNRSVWENPTGGETNAFGIINQFSDPNNRPQLTNNSQNFYNQFMQNMPTVSSDPGYGAYFQHAKDRSAESINQTMAARGAYGSSAANDQISRAYSDLDAQQAEKEADYNLRRLGEQRAWNELGSHAASSADTSSVNNSAENRSWEDFLGKLGLDASKLGMDRTNAGQDAANAASAEKSRVAQDAFNNELAKGDRLSENTLRITMQALGMDSELIDKILSGGIAAGTTAANNETTNANNTLAFGDAAIKGFDFFNNQ